MLNRIIRFALNNRIVVLTLASLLIAGGLYSVSTMDVDVFPDLNAPTVIVMTEAKGMAAEEVEKLVTFPVETAVNGATSVRRVRSQSTGGFSIVTIEFDWGTDIYRARQIVSEKLAMLEGSLPDNVGQPTLGPQSSILGEMLIVGLSASKTSMLDLRSIADWSIRPRLLATGGVAQVAVMGGDIKEYQIKLINGKMRRMGVSMDEVIDAVKDLNRNVPGGTLYQYGNEYIVRGLLATSDTEELSKAVIKSGEHPVTLGDIASISIGSAAPKLGVAAVNGVPAVLLTVNKQPEVSTGQLTERIETALDELKVSLPPDVKVHTDIFRQSDFIDNSINNVKKSLLEGSLFVILVLIIFLLNWRTTVISLVSIPVSVLISMLVLKAFGLTINTMSLGGIAIAIGSLVDDSIVDVENVFKRLRQNRSLPPDKRKSSLETVFEASREVRMPMLESTLIIIASFLPLFFLSGMEGKMLIPLGIAFVTALMASTLVALTLTPVLCFYLLSGDKVQERSKDPSYVISMRSIYSRALTGALRHKKIMLAGTGALLIFAIVLLLGTGRSFLPPFNEGALTISMSSVPGISLQESDSLGHKAEQILLSIPEIHTVGRKTGRAELDEHSFGVNVSEFECPFTLKDRSRQEFIADVRKSLSVIPGINLEIGGPISHRMDEMLSGTQANIAVKLFGPELPVLRSLAARIKESVSEIPGIVDVNVEQQVERPELNIVPNRNLMARYGVTMAEFSEAVEVLLEGKTVSQVYEGNSSCDIVLKADGEKTIESLGNITVNTSSGEAIPLSSISTVVSTSGPNTVSRENASRKIVISCNVDGISLSKAVSAIKEEIGKDITLPEGCHIEYGGQFESEERASRTIALVSIFSILIIFLLLFSEFRSTRQTLTVLLNLPLALIGGIIAIRFTDGMLSIPAIIGFISLFGIATRNGMLLIDRYNVLRAEGISKTEAIVKGSADRLSPILMTAITSALALLPLALGSDLPGNEIQSPMAKVILGGLLSSTLLNGFIIPIMYSISEKEEK